MSQARQRGEVLIYATSKKSYMERLSTRELMLFKESMQRAEPSLAMLKRKSESRA